MMRHLLFAGLLALLTTACVPMQTTTQQGNGRPKPGQDGNQEIRIDKTQRYFKF